MTWGRCAVWRVVVGGDGTMLGISRHLAKYGTPLVGINQGRLGFVTDIPLSATVRPCSPILLGEYEEDTRPLMHARVVRDGSLRFRSPGRERRGGQPRATSGMVELRVEVDGRFLSNQRADGLIVATPTGSTAYALSVGGPLMHPIHPGLADGADCPAHAVQPAHRAVRTNTEVMLEVVGGRDISANFDMQSLSTSLLLGDRIYVRRSEHSVRFLHPKGWNYFATLRKKLGWNEQGTGYMSLRRIALRDFVIVPAAGAGFCTGLYRADRRDRCGQIHFDRRAAAGAGRTRRYRRGARRRQPKRTSAPNLIPRPGRALVGGRWFCPEDALLLRRVIDTQGRSRAWINGSPATATQLRRLGELLLDIHGQHAWQSLMRADSVRALLDDYAGMQSDAAAAALAGLAHGQHRAGPGPGRAGQPAARARAPAVAA